VGEVVLDDGDAAVGELGADLEVEVVGGGDRTDYGDGVHVAGPGAGEVEAPGDGVCGKLAGGLPVGAVARELGLFDSGYEVVIFEDGRGGIAEQAADPEDDHLGFEPRFSIFAQVSFRATVRLKTGAPGLVSGSTQK